MLDLNYIVAGFDLLYYDGANRYRIYDKKDGYIMTVDVLDEHMEKIVRIETYEFPSLSAAIAKIEELES